MRWLPFLLMIALLAALPMSHGMSDNHSRKTTEHQCQAGQHTQQPAAPLSI
jgi:hypothetical protein